MRTVATWFAKRIQSDFQNWTCKVGQKLFIVGTGRCGTKLLRKMLNLHPDISLAKETAFIPVLYEKFGMESISFDEYFNVIDEHYGSNGMKWIEALAKEAGRNPKSIKEDFSSYYGNGHGNIATFTESFYEYLYGKNAVMGDKTPHYGLIMTAIKDIWPNSKFIHLLRDGVFATDSMMSHPGFVRWVNSRASVSEILRSHYRGKILKYSDGRVTFGDCRELWKKLLLEILEQKKRIPEKDYLEIKYEDLVRNPFLALTRIANFLNLRQHKLWAIKASIIPRPFYLNKVMNRISDEEYQEKVVEIFGLMQLTGYPLGKRLYRGLYLREFFRSLGYWSLNGLLLSLSKAKI